MSGENLLMTQLLVGSGLRLMECLRLRVKDVDFEQHQIIVRDPKGMHDRTTMIYTHVLNHGSNAVRSPLDE
jgi:integrase